MKRVAAARNRNAGRHLKRPQQQLVALTALYGKRITILTLDGEPAALRSGFELSDAVFDVLEARLVGELPDAAEPHARTWTETERSERAPHVVAADEPLGVDEAGGLGPFRGLGAPRALEPMLADSPRTEEYESPRPSDLVRALELDAKFKDLNRDTPPFYCFRRGSDTKNG